MDYSSIIIDLDSSSSTFEQVDEQKDKTLFIEDETSKETTETPKQLQHKAEIFYQCYSCDFITKHLNLFNSHKAFAHPQHPSDSTEPAPDGEKNIVEGKRQNKRKFKTALCDNEKILLLQYVSKLQLNKYYESVDTIKNALDNKWYEVSKIFKENGYSRAAAKLGGYFVSMRVEAMSRMKRYYIQRSAVRPRNVDYLFANLFPKHFEELSLDMNELMADALVVAKIYSKEMLEYLVPLEDQERPTILDDIASLGHLNDVELRPILERRHSEETEGPPNKIAKEVHEDEDAWLKRMLDITRGLTGRNNCESTSSKSLTIENNSSTDDINELKAKLLVAEDELRKKNYELERKTLEISYLKELHAKELEIEKVKRALDARNVENKI
ncbi:unnamed protein product [Diabrotica balteata]|uniref:Uncharacterized protein n=1 Tax=Diabrotica balteata TaxID=107213 RepID=A0A9N9SY99_DIABA|nr:unnamed protein product [Diabrotica balteata]